MPAQCTPQKTKGRGTPTCTVAVNSLVTYRDFGFFAPLHRLHVTYLGHESPHLLLGGVVTQGSQAAPAGQLFEEGEVAFSQKARKG